MCIASFILYNHDCGCTFVWPNYIPCAISPCLSKYTIDHLISVPLPECLVCAHWRMRRFPGSELGINDEHRGVGYGEPPSHRNDEGGAAGETGGGGGARNSDGRNRERGNAGRARGRENSPESESEDSAWDTSIPRQSPHSSGFSITGGRNGNPRARDTRAGQDGLPLPTRITTEGGRVTSMLYDDGTGPRIRTVPGSRIVDTGERVGESSRSRAVDTGARIGEGSGSRTGSASFTLRAGSARTARGPYFTTGRGALNPSNSSSRARSSFGERLSPIAEAIFTATIDGDSSDSTTGRGGGERNSSASTTGRSVGESSSSGTQG